MSVSYHMDAVIRPNRSLSQRGFIILISLLTAINCITALVFLRIGATLVPLFLGLDLVAVIIAFMVSNRAAEHVERVRVTSLEVRVTREWRDQAQTIWVSPTAYTRVLRVADDHEDDELRLRLSDKEVAVAQALSPKERAAFGQALDLAIWTARRQAAAGFTTLG